MRLLLTIALALSLLAQVASVDAAGCRRSRTPRPVTIVRGHFNMKTGVYTRSHYRRSHVIHTYPAPIQPPRPPSVSVGSHWVRGYRRRDGTYVAPHWRQRGRTPRQPRSTYALPPAMSAVLPPPPSPRYSPPTPPPSTAPSTGTVWVDTKSGIFHAPGTRWYGRTKQGEYMPEADAIDKGYRPSRSGQ